MKGLGKKPGEEAAREAVLEVLREHAGGKSHGQLAAAGRLVIQPGDERKRTSSHYTPRELTEPVVRRTLAPILRTMEAEGGGPPSSEALLELASGHVGQLLVSQDVCMKIQLAAYGGFGLGHLLAHVRELFDSLGGRAADWEAITRHTPARLLAWAPA